MAAADLCDYRADDMKSELLLSHRVRYGVFISIECQVNRAFRRISI